MLKKKYLIEKREVLLDLSPSVTFHWMNLQCEKLVPFSAIAAQTMPISDPVKVPEQTTTHTYAGEFLHKITDTLSHLRHVDADQAEMTPTDPSAASESKQSMEVTQKHRCTEMLSQHHVVPGSSWGTLPEDQQRLVSAFTCHEYCLPLQARSILCCANNLNL